MKIDLKQVILLLVMIIMLLFIPFSTMFCLNKIHPKTDINSRTTYVKYGRAKEYIKKDMVVTKIIGYINISTSPMDFLTITSTKDSKILKENINILSGRFPKNSDEILIPNKYLNLFEIKGDQINIAYCDSAECNNIITKTYKISGVYEEFELYNSFYVYDKNLELSDDDYVNIYGHYQSDKPYNLLKIDSINEETDEFNYQKTVLHTVYTQFVIKYTFLYVIEIILITLLGIAIYQIQIKRKIGSTILLYILLIVGFILNSISIISLHNRLGNNFIGYTITNKDFVLKSSTVDTYRRYNDLVTVSIDDKVYNSNIVKLSSKNEESYFISLLPQTLEEIHELNNLESNKNIIINGKYNSSIVEELKADWSNQNGTNYIISIDGDLKEIIDNNLNETRVNWLLINKKDLKHVQGKNYLTGKNFYNVLWIEKSILNFHFLNLCLILIFLLNYKTIKKFNKYLKMGNAANDIN